MAFEDIRQIVPCVLHDRLVQNPDCPVFVQEDKKAHWVDRISSIRGFFDAPCREYEKLKIDREIVLDATAGGFRGSGVMFQRYGSDLPKGAGTGGGRRH